MMNRDTEQFGELVDTQTQPGGVQIDAARQQQAVAFARDMRRARLIFQLIVIVLVALIIFLVSEFSWLLALINAVVAALAQTPVLNWQPVSGWPPVLVLMYFVIAAIFLSALSLPFSWYLTSVLPRRHGIRRRSTQDWLGLASKGLLVFFTYAWVIVELAVLFRALQPQTWWIWAALAQFLISILLARLGSLRFLPYLNELEPLRSAELLARFQMLTRRLQLPPCRILQMNVSHRTGSVNAFFTGWGRGRRVILTDTMVQSFTPDEIEVILAHELAHFIHHDIWTRLVMGGLTFLGFFYLINIYLTSLVTEININSPMSFIQPFLPLLVLILLLIFVGLTVRYRRYQEYQADEFALQTTGKIQAFKDAMTRLTNMNMMVATSTRRARHPASHPTLLKRLRHADEFAARQGLQ